MITSSSSSSNPALELLATGIAALTPGFQPSGELNDPVFHEPTQYGTAYFAYCNAVLAQHTTGAAREAHVRIARLGLENTLRHLSDPDDPNPPAADFSQDVGSPGFRNLRDFMWPPVIRTYRILRDLGVPDLQPLAAQISAVDVPGVFSERPPVNWAAVWILGEWQRMQLGLSPFDRSQIDDWLEPFFSENPDVDHGFYKELREATGLGITWGSAIDLERGFYREPGVPNSYDLFSRVHLLELLVEGYEGVYAVQMRALLVAGLRRSLGVQLSAGSLASAYRSTAHLWNLTTQAWYFFHAARLLADEEPELADRASQAAALAFRAVRACLRPTGDLSPVENVLPAGWRVGYEVYTMEAHYVTLPLAYLADAVDAGYTGTGDVPADTSIRLHLEDDPVNRHLAHRDGWSVHVNLAPFDGYDSFGIADITLGPDRRLRFGGQAHYGRADAESQAHKLSNQTRLTLGLALRQPDRSIHPVSAMMPSGSRGAHALPSGFRAFANTPAGRYEIVVEIEGDRVRVSEELGDGARSLMLPYLRDRGDGFVTEVEVDGNRVSLQSGDELVEITVEDAVEKTVHLPFGYESRHGLLGLLRLDLGGSGPAQYEVRRVR